MTRALERGAAAPPFAVREERDPRALRALLEEDAAYAAFALGCLEPEALPRARFWTAEGEDGRCGVVMHARGAPGRTSVLMGDAAAVGAALALHPGPRWGYLATCAPEHLPAVRRVHELGGELRMRRMSVRAHGFREPAQPPGGGVRRLGRADAGALNALYASGGGPAGYRGEHVERGVYWGAFEARRLIAAAGTHILAPNHGVAVVGNVFTHAGARGRGLAGAVTGAVTRELLERGCALVALTVDPANEPAVRAYRRLGYEPGAAIVEARMRRRDPLGVGAALRRRFAPRGEDGAALARGPRTGSGR